MEKLFSYMLLFVAALSFVACSNDDYNSPAAPKDNAPNGAEAIDLGLSIKWANMNIGATTPEGYGWCFAWGETSHKDYYDWNTYRLCKGSSSTMTKYCTSSSFGTLDNKTTLELADDVAHVNWGGSWRMPTGAEQNELRTKCTWEWKELNGKKGFEVTGPNGNFIFLPAAGYRDRSDLYGVGFYGGYWSSSLYESYPSVAYGFYFYSDGVYWGYYNRFRGLSVRAVCQ